MKGSLEELVRESGLGDAELVHRALKRAAREGIVLVRALVDEGVSERQLAETIAAYAELRLVELPTSTGAGADESHDDEPLREVPHSLALQHALVPLSVDRAARTLKLAMANPFDAAAIEEIEAQSGLTVVPLVARLSAVLARARFVYRGCITEMITRRPTFGVVGDGRPLEPKTTPLHEVSGEAAVEVRLTALIELLEATGVIDGKELAERVRALLRQRAQSL